jgi:hypothetical protein
MEMFKQTAPALAQKTQSEDGVARHKFEQRVRDLDPGRQNESVGEVLSSVGHSIFLQQMALSDAIRVVIASASFCQNHRSIDLSKIGIEL